MLLALVALPAALVSRADAQACHVGAVASDPSRSVGLALTAVVGAYDNASGSGQYQGLIAEARYQRAWLRVALVVPGYRIERDGSQKFGVGDVALDLRLNVLERMECELSGGIAVATSAPTGNANRGLGMGHVMLMSGLWAQLQTASLTVLVDARYGRAVAASATGGSGGAHAAHTASSQGSASSNGASGPIVQPMNRSEVELALSVAYRVTAQVAPFARLFGAVPVADAQGTARQAVAAGLIVTLGPVDVSAEVQVPIVGDPFTARGLVGGGGGF